MVIPPSSISTSPARSLLAGRQKQKQIIYREAEEVPPTVEFAHYSSLDVWNHCSEVSFNGMSGLWRVAMPVYKV